MTAKTAIVTGSTSGIGLGIARALATSGYQVMLNGLGDAGEIEATRSALAAESGMEIGFHGADMTKPEDIEDLIRSTEARFGAIDLLVNNAGIQFVAPIEDFPPERWNTILQINLTSAFHAIRCTLPKMKARKAGRIINIASAHALVASPFKSAYISAKHGVAGLTKTVSLEVAQFGITVNAICPGYVMTPLVEK